MARMRESSLDSSTWCLPFLLTGAWENSTSPVDTLKTVKLFKESSARSELRKQDQEPGLSAVISRAQNGYNHSSACSVGIEQGFRNQSIAFQEKQMGLGAQFPLNELHF